MRRSAEGHGQDLKATETRGSEWGLDREGIPGERAERNDPAMIHCWFLETMSPHGQARSASGLHTLKAPVPFTEKGHQEGSRRACVGV